MKRLATILLVEDDKSMLEGIHDLLLAADFGYELEVLMAGDGLAALDKMAEQTPDLIISDVMMPRMDGYQLLQRVRGNPAWIRIPVIFLTAKGEKAEVRRGRRSGVDLYLVKPFDSDELIELIESQLSRTFRLQLAHQQSVEAFKKNILQVLNHEFRTPLTYVTAYYEMLAEGLSTLEDHQDLHEYLRGIQSGSVRLTRLIEDLIQVMELRTGEAAALFQASAAPIEDLNQLLSEVVSANQQMAERQGVRIHHDVDDCLPAVFGHKAGLRNAFDRLLNNAVKFSRPRDGDGGNVYVTSSLHRDEVHVRFEDEGVGFPDRMRSSIFELFFQYNRGLLEQQGAGVGLTIAKGWVDLHHGRIVPVSQEDVGSQFTVVLPVHSDDGTPRRRLIEARRQATVLIVEDDAHLLGGLQELLEIGAEKYVYRIVTATNGVKGLEQVAAEHPDLIISDIMMPQMDGYEFLERIRRHPDWLHIPFIFLSAKGDPREIHAGLRVGAEAYLTKPYSADELLELVTKQLDRYYALQGALARNFESLKRSILDLITPDFRLPLSSVAKFSEELAEGFKQAQTEVELKSSLEGIQKSSSRLTRLVEDFISLAELRTGEAATAHELRSQPIADIGLLFFEAGRMATHRAHLRHVQLRCDEGAKLPIVFGNSAAIYDSVQRLLEATVTFLEPPCTQIVLATSYAAGEAHLTMRFLEPANSSRLAELREILCSADAAPRETSKNPTGFMIARGFVELHQGRIEVTVGEEGGFSVGIVLPEMAASNGARAD